MAPEGAARSRSAYQSKNRSAMEGEEDRDEEQLANRSRNLFNRSLASPPDRALIRSTVRPRCRRKKRLDRDDETTQAQEVGMSTGQRSMAAGNSVSSVLDDK
ncbi:unnamed protein product [Miscanthus lutarioriparius]|uniref:Uncharacterized protein n=1 Tax=Miscanthus lutarioriparius TaxID=422564 RepID=A0A811RF91_9POAL|nr:unnamed protein product [Miscanthus lutarioriparius]